VKRTPDGTLDDALDLLEELDDAGDDEALRRALAEARAAHPDAVELLQWEADLAADAGRLEDALAFLDEAIRRHPRRFEPRREHAALLIDCGRFAEARAALEGLLSEARRRPRQDRASLHHDLALCLDRLGDRRGADASFARAHHLDPEQHFVPIRHDAAEFHSLVERALDGLPRRIARHLAQVVVTVADHPTDPTLDPFALGSYHGLPRSERTAADADHLDTIVVYQRCHELQCRTRRALAEEIRRTVVHEIAHHFGFEHGDMGEYE